MYAIIYFMNSLVIGEKTISELDTRINNIERSRAWGLLIGGLGLLTLVTVGSKVDFGPAYEKSRSDVIACGSLALGHLQADGADLSTYSRGEVAGILAGCDLARADSASPERSYDKYMEMAQEIVLPAQAVQP